MRRPFLLLSLALLVVFCSHGSPVSAPERSGPAQTQQPFVELEALTPAGEEELHGILASSRLSELQWPNFSQQSAAAKEFYDEAGYRLAWTRSGKPTPQATELIGILENAEQKGLDSRDYDGERWPERLSELQGPSTKLPW